MTVNELKQLPNESWLGRLRLYKPKKNEKIGIPYKSWHHLAFIDNYVILYVWDTREIIDVYPIVDVKPAFNTIKLTDNAKALRIGSDTSERAKNIIKDLLSKYADLPILDKSYKLGLADVKECADAALLDVDFDYFDIYDQAQVVFVDKSLPLPDNLYMYDKQLAVNPNKTKLVDNNAYTGMAKYFAIQARCALLKDWRDKLKDLQ